MKAGVAVIIPKVGKVDGVAPEGVTLRGGIEFSRMGSTVRFEEPAPLVAAEVTDFEDYFEVAPRHGRGIRRIGDLRDEAAVLAERGGKALARA